MFDDTWDTFEQRTGLVVPAGTRAAIDRATDPEALVEYLSVHEGGFRSLLTVTLVPVLACIVPAALIILSI